MLVIDLTWSTALSSLNECVVVSLEEKEHGKLTQVSWDCIEFSCTLGLRLDELVEVDNQCRCISGYGNAQSNQLWGKHNNIVANYPLLVLC